MKNVIFLLLVLAGGFLVYPGCKKSSSSPSDTNNSGGSTPKTDSSTYVSVSQLAAKWSIVSDTVTNVNNFTVDFYEPPSRNYIGGPNDYISFTAAGVVSGTEDSVAIAGTYALGDDSTITLSMLPALSHAKITKITANALTIAGVNTAGNGNSSLSETIYLKR